MKFCLSFLILFSAYASGVDFQSVLVEVKEARVYRPELYSFRRQVVISNAQQTWILNFLQLKSDGVRPPYCKLTIKAGETGFCPLVEFFRLTVNGISLSSLLPNKNDLFEWRTDQARGADLRLNYDGVRLVMRFHMTADSPMLHVTLKPADGSLDTIRSAYAELALIPSHLAKKDGTVVWGGAYHRMVITPARTIEQTDSPVCLTEQDDSLVILDEIFDGTSPEKGMGPSFIKLDHSGLRKAEIRVANSYTTNLDLTLCPDFKALRFSLFQHGERISNSDFLNEIRNSNY